MGERGSVSADRSSVVLLCRKCRRHVISRRCCGNAAPREDAQSTQEMQTVKDFIQVIFSVLVLSYLLITYWKIFGAPPVESLDTSSYSTFVFIIIMFTTFYNGDTNCIHQTYDTKYMELCSKGKKGYLSHVHKMSLRLIII